MQKLTLAVTCCSLFACTHGSFAPSEELELSAFSRKDLCCSATLNQIGVNRWEAFGCGKRAMYKRIDGEWQRMGQVQPEAGSPSNQLPDCTQ
jgi:hypothetical protein